VKPVISPLRIRDGSHEQTKLCDGEGFMQQAGFKLIVKSKVATVLVVFGLNATLIFSLIIIIIIRQRVSVSYGTFCCSLYIVLMIQSKTLILKISGKITACVTINIGSCRLTTCGSVQSSVDGVR